MYFYLQALLHTRLFNLHLDFWKWGSASNLSSCKPGFFFRSPPKKKKLDLHHTLDVNPGNKLKKKSRCAGPEIFLQFETGLNFSRWIFRNKGADEMADNNAMAVCKCLWEVIIRGKLIFPLTFKLRSEASTDSS